MLVADNAQDQDFQQVLAYLVRAVGGIPHFVEHLGEQVRDQRFVAEVAEDLHAGLLVCRLEGDPLHADDIILQRRVFDGLLRVLHVGRDDDKVPCPYMVLFIPEKEVPLSVYDKKQFCKMVRVENTLPVLFVLGERNGQEPGVQLFQVGRFDGVLSVAHRTSPVIRCF